MLLQKINRIPIVVAVILLTIGCSQDYLEPEQTAVAEGGSRGILALNFASGGIRTTNTDNIISRLQLYAFHRGGSSDGFFSHEIPGLTYSDNTLKGYIRTGDWYMNMVSAQQVSAGETSAFHTNRPAQIVKPVFGSDMSLLPMYVYEPQSGEDGNSTCAHEIWFQKLSLPTISSVGTHTVETSIARNVSQLNIIVRKEHATSDPSSPWYINPNSIVIEVSGVPSTLSWEGKVLPSKEHPTTCSVRINQPSSTEYNETEGLTVRYDNLIIPAHRGDDFWNPDGKTMNPSPTDILEQKLTIKLSFSYKNGIEFTSSKEIPLVPICNGRLNITLLPSDMGMDMTVERLPWNVEEEQEEMPYEQPEITNCYVVKPGRGVAIPVKGVYQAWNYLPEFTAANDPMDPSEELEAEVIWDATAKLHSGEFLDLKDGSKLELPDMDPTRNGGLIESVHIDKGSSPDDYSQSALVVQCAEGKIGSALVGIRQVNDPADTYRWSYHIWVTDYDPNSPDGQVTYNGVTWMTQNLATYGGRDMVEKYLQAVNQYAFWDWTQMSVGLYYERGRKDPMPFTVGMNYSELFSLPMHPNEWDSYDSGLPAGHAYQQSADGPLIPYWTRHPETWSRYSTDMYEELRAHNDPSWWGCDASGQHTGKTIYDPCPAGWHMPDINDAQTLVGSTVEPLPTTANWVHSFRTEIGYAFGTIMCYGLAFTPRLGSGYGVPLHLGYWKAEPDIDFGQQLLAPVLFFGATSPLDASTVVCDIFDRDPRLDDNATAGLIYRPTLATKGNPSFPIRCVKDRK